MSYFESQGLALRSDQIQVRVEARSLSLGGSASLGTTENDNKRLIQHLSEPPTSYSRLPTQSSPQLSAQHASSFNCSSAHRKFQAEREVSSLAEDSESQNTPQESSEVHRAQFSKSFNGSYAHRKFQAERRISTLLEDG